MILRMYSRGLWKRVVKDFLRGLFTLRNGLRYKMSIEGQTYEMVVRSMFEYIMLQSAGRREKDLIRFVRELSAEDVFLDIGANIGIYSIFAAGRVKEVYSFEPHFASFSSLCANIIANGCQNVVRPFSFALGNCSGTFEQFNVIFGDSSASGSQVNHCRRFGTEFIPEISYCVYVDTLDNMLSKRLIAFPTAIKIDVDGIETQIIDGALRTLADKKLKKLMLELDDSQDVDNTVKRIEERGLTLRERNLISTDGTNCRNYWFER